MAVFKVWKFICRVCGERDGVFAPVNQTPEAPSCKCGKMMRPDFTRPQENGGLGVAGCETARTFWSQSLAISPEQATEHRRLFPNVEIAPDGQLGFHSHKERERYCEACGFEKKPARIRA